MSKIEHEGVTYDLPDQVKGWFYYDPHFDCWEFKAHRPAHYQELYYDPHFDVVKPWRQKEDSKECYWIATRVKPVLAGWEFLEDKPRLPKKSEGFYASPLSGRKAKIMRATRAYVSDEYWIATRIKTGETP